MKDLERIANALEQHTEHDDVRFGRIEEKLDIIKDNHLAHIQEDIADQTSKLATNTTNTEWLMKYHWIVATASIGALVASVINLLK